MNTYDPQKSTPLKEGKSTCCPACGAEQSAPPVTVDNRMSRYCNKITSRTIVVAGVADTITVGDIPYYRINGTDSKGKPTSTFAP